MCTVTFSPRRDGYLLAMNRDEKLARPPGLPAALHQVGPHQALFPSEPGGGTWIGVNDAGITLALINWYSVSARVSGVAVSRGEVVGAGLRGDDCAHLESALANLPLQRINPFRLIGVFPRQRSVMEWRWDMASVERVRHEWAINTWISSGWDEPGAQRSRSQAFQEALRRRSAGNLEWLGRFHRSHRPERGPYSVCMHREDAATVSYTEIKALGQHAELRYTGGAPCCTEPGRSLSLRLRQSLSISRAHAA
jgi:hypothetical protein